MSKEIRVYVPDDFHRKVNTQAADEGKTIKEVVVALLKTWLKEKGIEVE